MENFVIVSGNGLKGRKLKRLLSMIQGLMVHIQYAMGLLGTTSVMPSHSVCKSAAFHGTMYQYRVYGLLMV